MSMLGASQSHQSPYLRAIQYKGENRQLKIRQPQNTDLGNAGLNAARDELVGTVMSLAAALAPNDNLEGFDEEPEPGKIVATNLALNSRGEVARGLSAGGARRVRLADIKLAEKAEFDEEFEGADPNAVYVRSARIRFEDGGRLWFDQNWGQMTFNSENSAGQICKLKVKADGEMEWNVFDSNPSPQKDWAQ